MKASPASSLPKGKREFGLFFGLSIAQRRGRTIFVHFWCLDIAQWCGGLIRPVLTPEERPALGVLGVSKHFGAKVAPWCPRLGRRLLQQRHIVLRVSENTKAKCSEHQMLGPTVHN